MKSTMVAKVSLIFTAQKEGEKVALYFGLEKWSSIQSCTNGTTFNVSISSFVYMWLG